MAKNSNEITFWGIIADMLQGLFNGSGVMLPPTVEPPYPQSRRGRRTAERRTTSSRAHRHAKARYGQFTLETSGEDPVGMMNQLGAGVTKTYAGIKVAERGIGFVFDTAEKVRDRVLESNNKNNNEGGGKEPGKDNTDWSTWFKERFPFPELPNPLDCIVALYPEGQRNAMLLHLMSLYGALGCPRVCATYSGRTQWPILGVVVEGEAGQGKGNFAEIYNNCFARIIASDNVKNRAGTGIIQNIGSNTTMAKYVKYVDANKGIPFYMFEEELDTLNTNLGKQGRLPSEIFRKAFDNGYIDQNKDDGSPCGKFRASFNYTATGTPDAVRRFIGNGDENGLASRVALAKIEDRDFNFDVEQLTDEDYRALQDQIDDLRKKYCYTTDSNGQDTPCQEHRVDLGYVEAALKNWEKEQVAMADEGDNRDYLRRDWCGRMSTIAFRCAIVVATLYGFPEQEQDTERQSIVKIALYIANYCMERGHKLFAKDHNRRREVNHQAEQMHIEGVSCSTAAGSTAQDPMDPQALYKLYVEQNQSYRDVERIVKRLLPPGTPSSYGTIRTRIMAYAKANNLPLPSSKQSVKSNKKL